MRVYWGGAAIALLLDADLRRGPEGRTLDDALRAMRDMELADADEVSAEEWMQRLDGWLGRPLFTTTAEACLSSREFPAVEAALADLGVSLRGGRAAFDDAAPGAAARRAMTAASRRP
jgi:predicted metalloprotease with PDZ domain